MCPASQYDNMSNRKVLAGLMAAVLLLCTACSGKAFEMDVQAAADTILEQAPFTDTLMSLPETQLESYYPKLASVAEEYAVYMSATGLTTEEIAVAKAGSGSKAADVKARFEKRLEDQRFRYETYLPAEVPRLDKAVIQTKGDYVVMIVCGDESRAAEILKELLK